MEYNLQGPQNEPSSAWWLRNSKIGVIDLDKLRRRVDADRFPTDNLADGVDQLRKLSLKRNVELPQGYLSEFINLQPAPFGAIIDTTGRSYKITNVNNQRARIFQPDMDRQFVSTGRELARMFEIETPGLVHRHALNWLLYHRPDISPVRQARIWLALDLAIYSALSAAWYYKWADPATRFRPRPIEIDGSLDVEADRVVNNAGTGDGPARTCPVGPSRGTPRHPAFPSGHSTYSSAASRILQYFFCETVPPGRASEVRPREPDNWPQEIDPSHSRPADPPPAGRVPGEYNQAWVARQLDKLTDNIGWARLWHGVHWGSDHLFGQKVGEAVADLVIEQLERDCIAPFDPRPCSAHPDEDPPSHDAIRDLRDLRDTSRCDRRERRHDFVEPREINTREIGTFLPDDGGGIEDAGTY